MEQLKRHAQPTKVNKVNRNQMCAFLPNWSVSFQYIKCITWSIRFWMNAEIEKLVKVIKSSKIMDFLDLKNHSFWDFRPLVASWSWYLRVKDIILQNIIIPAIIWVHTIIQMDTTEFRVWIEKMTVLHVTFFRLASC